MFFVDTSCGQSGRGNEARDATFASLSRRSGPRRSRRHETHSVSLAHSTGLLLRAQLCVRSPDKRYSRLDFYDDSRSGQSSSSSSPPLPSPSPRLWSLWSRSPYTDRSATSRWRRGVPAEAQHPLERELSPSGNSNSSSRMVQENAGDHSSNSVLLNTFIVKKKRCRVYFHRGTLIWETERPPYSKRDNCVILPRKR